MTALLLMGLIVLIHVAKAFHHHNDSIQPEIQVDKYSTASLNHSSYTSTIFANHSCSICYFHIAKDLDANTSFNAINVPKSYSQFNTARVCDYFLTTPETILLRGPPSVI